MKRIKENWKAIEECESHIREKTGDPEAGFNPTLFFLGKDIDRQLLIPCKYRGQKGKKGAKEFTQSYKEIMINAEYCPFTGKPLYYD